MKAAALSFASLLALSGVARAELPASPQHLMVEVKFGPYVPHIGDSISLHGSTTYSDVFGDQSSAKGSVPPWGLLGQGEVDYQFFHGFGVLGIGISAGYHYRTAKQFVIDPTRNDYCSVQANDSGGRKYVLPAQADKGLTEKEVSYSDCISDDEDKLNVVPLSLLLSYRFDVLDKRFGIPIIPYMKVGLAYYVWWFGNTNAYVTQVMLPSGESVDAKGGSLGLTLHPGLALDLSALDPSAARAIDQEVGLNRVTLFAEMNYAWVNGFGQGNKLNLSDTTFSAGLGFEF